MITVVAGDVPTKDELLELYGSVGWSEYTDNADDLVAAVQGSTYVVAARQGGKLVGFARVVSDDQAIAYIQDILISPDHQGQGLGTRLMEDCLSRFAHVRTVLLLTDHEKRQHAFYKKLGFTDIRDTALHSFVRFKRP